MAMGASRSKSSQSPAWVKGTPVEVTSDEDGFAGAWYVAEILKSPSSYSKSRKGKVLVQYQSLVADENANTRLTEYVDPDFIRPRPPAEDKTMKVQSFEVYDVVDALYNDGWWKGVVTKVKDFGDVGNNNNCKKYHVVFDNPPDQHEFTASSLRFHLDWVRDTWVRPKKQKRMKGLKFSIGMNVEVNLGVEIPNDDWFPATILQEIDFNSFLVKLSNSSNKDKSSLIKAPVDSFHIRLPHPDSKDKQKTGKFRCISGHANSNAKSQNASIQLECSSASTEEIIPCKHSRKLRKQKSTPHDATCKSKTVKDTTSDGVTMLSHPCKKCRRENSSSSLFLEECHVMSMLNEKPCQEPEAVNSTEIETTVMETNLEEAASKNGMVLSVENGNTPIVSPVKKQPFLREGDEKDDIKEYSVDDISNFKCITRVKSLVALAKETRGLHSVQGTSNLANKNSKSTEVAVQLECSSSAKSDIVESTPCTCVRKRTTYSGMYSGLSRKRAACRGTKEISPTNVTSQSTPCKKLRIENSANPLSSLEDCAKSVLGETSNQEAEFAITTQTKFSLHHAVCNLPLTEESSLMEKNDETDQQESGVEAEKMISLEERGLLPDLGEKTELVQSAGVLIQETDQQETGGEDQMMKSADEGSMAASLEDKSMLVQTPGALMQETYEQETGIENGMIISKEEGLMTSSLEDKGKLGKAAGVPVLETNEQANGVEDERIVSMEEGGTLRSSQRKSELVQAAGVIMQETNQKETGVENDTIISLGEGGRPPNSKDRSNLVQTAGVLMQETDHQETEVGDEMMVSVEHGGRSPYSPFNTQLVLAAEDAEDNAGVFAKEVELRHVTEEVDLSLALVDTRGPCAEDSYQDYGEEANSLSASIDGELLDNQVAPFVKSSSIWEMVESLEIFKRMPQSPHFHPLAEYNELEREGSAIGKMAYFISLIEKTSMLQIDDPSKVFDSYLEALADLKRYGFDVERVLYRIKGLVSIKDKQTRLQYRSNILKTQIAECIQGGAESEENVNAIDRRIRELEEKRELAMSRKLVEDSEVSILEMNSSGISADILKADLEFESTQLMPLGN